MRRIRFVVLMLTMLSLTTCVWAGNPDLDSYDDTAIMDLLNQVQQEVADRHIEKTADFQAGKYIGGREVPSGTYLWTCRATTNDWGSMTIYSLNENGEHDKQLFWEVVSAPEDGEEPASFLITLNEGEELVSPVPFSLTIYAGPTFS